MTQYKSSITSLPVELLENIVHNLTLCDVGNLSAVCINLRKIIFSQDCRISQCLDNDALLIQEYIADIAIKESIRWIVKLNQCSKNYISPVRDNFLLVQQNKIKPLFEKFIESIYCDSSHQILFYANFIKLIPISIDAMIDIIPKTINSYCPTSQELLQKLELGDGNTIATKFVYIHPIIMIPFFLNNYKAFFMVVDILEQQCIELPDFAVSNCIVVSNNFTYYNKSMPNYRIALGLKDITKIVENENLRRP